MITRLDLNNIEHLREMQDAISRAHKTEAAQAESNALEKAATGLLEWYQLRRDHFGPHEVEELL